jgi:hypothetical protein
LSKTKQKQHHSQGEVLFKLPVGRGRVLQLGSHANLGS